MIKYLLARKDTKTYRSNITAGFWVLPSYTSKMDNAAIMSRRLAADQRQGNEVVVPVHVDIILQKAQAR